MSMSKARNLRYRIGLHVCYATRESPIN